VLYEESPWPFYENGHFPFRKSCVINKSATTKGVLTIRHSDNAVQRVSHSQLTQHEHTITQLLEIIAATNRRLAELQWKQEQLERWCIEQMQRDLSSGSRVF